MPSRVHSADLRQRNFGVRGAATIPLGPESLRDSSSLPEGCRNVLSRGASLADRASPPLLFGLAPRGVCRAPGITDGAVGSYPTFSPLPNALDQTRLALGITSGLPQRCKLTGGLILCGTFRSRAPKWLAPTSSMRNPLALPGALPNGVRTFLPLVPHRPCGQLETNRRSPDSPVIFYYTPQR